MVSVVPLFESNFASEFGTFRACFTLSAATGVAVIMDVSTQPESALRTFILHFSNLMTSESIILSLSKLTATVDYLDEIPLLIFPAQETAGTSRQCFDFLPINNDIADGDRTLSLVFTTSSPQVIASPLQIIIVDDECKQLHIA